MSDSGQVRKGGKERDQVDEQAESTAEGGTQELLDDVDDLLDEIDEVLEENAEEFVRGYVQKGGE